MKNEEHYLSVSQLNSLIKDKFDQDPELSSVYLRGELSNFKIYSSGHAYFSLKDNQAVISGLMWGSYVMYLPFEPKDGDEVLVHGKVSVYPPSGKYQIYCDHMELFGQGSELLKLKELAKKLQAEGLFDESRKRKLPAYPKTIGLITAKGSAAIKDMVVNIQKRWPLVDIIVFPSLVQGKDAPKKPH
jgi:exodeoxyribonuclease VII large subunit